MDFKSNILTSSYNYPKSPLSGHSDYVENNKKNLKKGKFKDEVSISSFPISPRESDSVKNGRTISNVGPSEKFSEEEEIIINILASSSTDYYD